MKTSDIMRGTFGIAVMSLDNPPVPRDIASFRPQAEGLLQVGRRISLAVRAPAPVLPKVQSAKIQAAQAKRERRRQRKGGSSS